MTSPTEGKPDHSLPPTIFPLRRAEEQASVFFLPDVGGNVFYARKIVPHLEPGLGVYGVRLAHEQLENLSGCTLQELGRQFAADLRASGLPEPFHLVGHSFAGFLAFETARHLAALDAPVGVLALLDSILPSRYDSAWYRRVIAALRSFMSQQRYLLRTTVFESSHGDPSMILHVPGFIRMDLTKHPESYRYIIRHLYRAMVEYEPGPYNGHLTLFRTMDSRLLAGVPSHLGWASYAKGRLDVIRLVGDHLDLVRDAHAAAQVAERLNQILSSTEHRRRGV